MLMSQRRGNAVLTLRAVATQRIGCIIARRSQFGSFSEKLAGRVNGNDRTFLAMVGFFGPLDWPGLYIVTVRK